MAQKIYDQHDQAFNQVSAFVVLKNGERVATIAFKFPKDGAGRLWCYFHWIGEEMVRAYAGGYGYDKRSAAIQHALAEFCKKDTPCASWPLTASAEKMDAGDWQHEIEKAGFQVFQAV